MGSAGVDIRTGEVAVGLKKTGAGDFCAEDLVRGLSRREGGAAGKHHLQRAPETSGTPVTPEAVSLLESVLNARNTLARAASEDGSVDVAGYCRHEILSVLPHLLRQADGTDADLFREVCYLIPQLADSSEAVVVFLRESVAMLGPELHQVATDALEEAEEVMEGAHAARPP
ncbi:hypothetical protein [Streptomyces sp. NPDC005012]|uniref:hypothetical protein n=1 Tax=Streptomyces sp. NPDC005012 TaxID=3154558 RepID=UPI0033B8834E